MINIYFKKKKSFQKRLRYFPDISAIYSPIYLRYFDELLPLLYASLHAQFFRRFIGSKSIYR